MNEFMKPDSLNVLIKIQEELEMLLAFADECDVKVEKIKKGN